MTTETEPGESGLKSVAHAFRILDVVARQNGPVPLKEIGRLAGVAPSKAHRYLQSLCTCGLLSQANKSGAYDLGDSALRIGLAAINRVDVINRAGEALPELVDETGADAFLTVWGDAGPTLIRFARSSHPSSAMLGAGVSMPALNTATGQVFLAFGNPDRTMPVAKREAGDAWPAVQRELGPKLQKVRDAGYAYSVGVIMAGRQCISAPIISFDDHVVAAVSLVSMQPDIIKVDGDCVRALKIFCYRHSVSKRGYVAESAIERKIAV